MQSWQRWAWAYALVGLVVLVGWTGAAEGLVEITWLGATAGQVLGVLVLVFLVATIVERAVEVAIWGLLGAKKVELDSAVAGARGRVIAAEEALAREKARERDGDSSLGEVGRRLGDLRLERAGLAQAVGAALDPAERKNRTRVARWLAVAFSVGAAMVGVRILGQLLSGEDGTLGGIVIACGSLADAATAATRAAAVLVEEGSNGNELGALQRAAKQLTDVVAELKNETSPVCDGARVQMGWLRSVDIILTTLVLAGGAERIHHMVNRVKTG